MNLSSFDKIIVKKKGEYVLVPSSQLTLLVSGTSWWEHVLEVPRSPSELTLAFLVRHHRQARGWSVSDLMREMGHKDPQHINSIERGETQKARQATLEALVRVLGPKFEAGLKLIQAIP